MERSAPYLNLHTLAMERPAPYLNLHTLAMERSAPCLNLHTLAMERREGFAMRISPPFFDRNRRTD